MPYVIVDENLWRTRLMPEGILTSWRVADGATVTAGELIAELAIEDLTHGVVAPADGILRQLYDVGEIIDPGAIIGEIP